MAEADTIPEGYHFAPRDYEFINYLRRRKNNQPQPCNRVIEVDLYGNVNHPSELFSGTNEIYFFTTLQKCENVDSRFKRRAGCGTWKGQNSHPVYDPNDRRRVIGDNKLFSFETGKLPKNSRYIMHEYSLPEDDNYYDVLCNIRVEQTRKARRDCSCADKEEVVQHRVRALNLSHDKKIGHGKKRIRDYGCEEDCDQSKRTCGAQWEEVVNTKLNLVDTNKSCHQT